MNPSSATKRSAMLKVAIVDQQRVFADALVYRLQNEVDFEVVCSTADTTQACAAVIDSRPHVVVLDAELSDGSAFEIAGRIRHDLMWTKVLFLTQGASDTLIEHALRLNADGIVSRDEPLLQLIQAIRRSAAGERTFSPAIHSRICFDPARRRFRFRVDPPTHSLTDRQLEILRLVARGETARAVAEKLRITSKAVDNQRQRIMEKLGVSDKVSLALYAVREGLIKP